MNRPHRGVSTLRGRYQRPALQAVAVSTTVLAAAGLVLPGGVGDAVAGAAVAVVTATPLVRVAWLVVRWAQERDWAFAALGVALLAVVGMGAGLTFVGGGS